MYQTITPVHRRSGKRIKVEIRYIGELPRGVVWFGVTKTRRGRKVLLTDKDCGSRGCRCDAYIEVI